jgi:hypothetical protein
MRHLIFEAAVKVKNQEECDVLRKICETHSLKLYSDPDQGFNYLPGWINYDADNIYFFWSDIDDGYFYIDEVEDTYEYNIISSKEFEQLAENFNPVYNNIDEILNMLNEINKTLNNK